MAWVIGALCLLGGVFAVIAGLGILRLQDILIRMHASTKAGTLASGLILAAVALHFADAEVTAKSVLAVVFILLTAPIAAHMIGRAALRLDVPLWRTSRVTLPPGRDAAPTDTTESNTPAP